MAEILLLERKPLLKGLAAVPVFSWDNKSHNWGMFKRARLAQFGFQWGHGIVVCGCFQLLVVQIERDFFGCNQANTWQHLVPSMISSAVLACSGHFHTHLLRLHEKHTVYIPAMSETHDFSFRVQMGRSLGLCRSGRSISSNAWNTCMRHPPLRQVSLLGRDRMY